MNIQFDGLVTVADGLSRKAKYWKNRSLAWSSFMDKLRTTKRTKETQAEYNNSDKDFKAGVKDVGGFVGGELKDGCRKAQNVISRHLVTLDADFADRDFWDKAKNSFNNAMCVYSTHSYTPENPRLRLIMPLSRPVSPDEYQAVCHKIAEKIGIDYFDDTTYQPHRLMFYPSTSIDAEFIFHYQDAEFISPDDILALYNDWRDISEWAFSKRFHDKLQKNISGVKAEDPTLKKGVIGAFCRAHTIHDAVNKFLSDVYEPCGADRYTFIGGTSFGGAVVYEDKWLYSFHNSDPCNMLQCNAFDLVRIHKFGDKDENSRQTDTSKLPSFAAMLDFCLADPDTKIRLADENMHQAQDDFDSLDRSWLADFELNKRGEIKNNNFNTKLVFDNDPGLKNSIAYDEFSHRIVVTGTLPWAKSRGETPSANWSNNDDSCLRSYLAINYGLTNSNIITDELVNVSMANRFHCVRDYLRSLKWDGINRIDTFFIDYLGAFDDNYTRSITRKSLIAGVARIMQPGIKFDSMIVLVGKQGKGKSTLLEKLGKTKWFTCSIGNLKDKDALVGLQGYWIIEFAELDAIKKSEISGVKSYISRTVDSFRPPYGKHNEDFPRQCVFYGTINEKNFLKDPTGNRRFLPIAINITKPSKGVFTDTIDDEIDQIWAEAFVAWNNHESLWYGDEMAEIAEKVQDRYTEELTWLGTIESFLEKDIPVDWYSRSVLQRVDYFFGNSDFDSDVEPKLMRRDKISAVEIWCEALGGELRRLSPFDSNKIIAVLEKLEDWTPYNVGNGRLNMGSSYGFQKAYIRKVDVDDL